MKTKVLNDIYKLWNKGLGYVADKHVYKFKDFSESIFDTQIQSKWWLCSELAKKENRDREIRHVSILAGWYGIVIIPMLYDKFGHNLKIDLYDIDECATDIASYMFNNYDNVNIFNKDVVFDDIEYKGDTIINCSCEHMYDMKDIVNENRGKLFAFQSNNNKNVKWLHINCVDNEEELISQTDLKQVYFKGSKNIYTHKRMMVVGK